MRRPMVSFSLPLCLFPAAHFLGAGGAVFRPVGFRREAGPALTAQLQVIVVFGNLGAQNGIQREDSSPEPAAQQGIGNALHTDTFLPIVQQEAVAAHIVAALPRQPPGLAVLRIVHLRYAHSSCFLSCCRGVTRKIPSTFCLMMPYSFSSFFTSPYLAYSRSFSSVSRPYSDFSAVRSGIFFTPPSRKARPAASYNIRALSCSCRNRDLSAALRYSITTGRVC